MSGLASPITVATPPAPGSGPARDPRSLRRSQLAASPGAVFCMGRAYWPRPARAGQAYVLEAAIGQAARGLRVPCVPTAGRGGDQHPGNNARIGAGWKDRESWHSRAVLGAAGVPRSHGSICPCNADDVGPSYKLKLLLKGVQDNSSDFGKCRCVFIRSQHRPMMK